MLTDHLDFDYEPSDIENTGTGKKEIYFEDKNILRKMYKLKHLYDNQQRTTQQQPNSNNWNFGSVRSQLLKPKKT